MVKEKKFYLTREGLQRLQKEYEDLKKIRLAKTKGEAPKTWHSEELNPEYLSFQEDISLLESRIAELEQIFKNIEIIKPPSKSQQSIVNLGASVLVEVNGQKDEFVIVGSLETDPMNNKISNESPIGQSLVGKKVGDTVAIKTPIVNHICKIVKIKYNQS